MSLGLVNAELFKVRTTSIWWILGIVLVPLYAASVLANWATFATTDPATTEGASDVQAEQVQAALEPVNVATTMYTSGQYFGILIVVLLAAIIVTSEFFHLTATTTFLTTPRRESVILAKFGAAIVVGLIVWLLTTVINLIVVPPIMSNLDVPTQLGSADVWRAIGLNALAFVLWAILGVGVGVLIRSQIAATLVLAISYVVGSAALQLVFFLLSQWVAEWINKLQVLVPTTASQLMISGTDLPGNPPRWVGAAVLIGYAAITGIIGTLITKRRDIS
ncbi:ABC transporter permease subunit [Paractinoplanes atraurantiacus]|uniref:ABC-2 family transporter protein n=1 Tax=Paractinoplanes atraurantiacus TaxID=1036182 RepID=A0A285FB63_9ACTN|nr:ABC transporter permease subunit [Actinoplanes atraurantiacus]SNY07974.1 ABC-2 family transporter protein [Actinoplanes atraurantiacus]